ncbi:MAG: glycosyltransferase family 4 protein [Ferruginibacter sp.]
MKIVCIHQGYELYGSDRSFLQVVKYLKQSGKFSKITVVLRAQGALVAELEKLDIEIVFVKLSLINKTYIKTFRWGKIIFPLFSLRKKYKFYNSYDIIYVNTSVILEMYLLAPFIKKKKILHIREIPAFPLNKFLSVLISRGNFSVIFNSASTKKSFNSFRKSYVIHNAFEGFLTVPYIEKIYTGDDELKLLLIGRINNWKGQDFAIEALSYLNPDEKIKLKIVGSPFEGNEVLLDELKEKARSLNIIDRIEFVDFISDTRLEYEQADIIIIPSVKPEPFGRTAIEAMNLKKPVIAANHGGLPEIVSNGYSGYLFTPNSIPEFITSIRKYYYNRDLLDKHGENSLKIFNEKFSVDRMYSNLDKVFQAT